MSCISVMHPTYVSGVQTHSALSDLPFSILFGRWFNNENVILVSNL